jgi:predicted DNA-binding protein
VASITIRIPGELIEKIDTEVDKLQKQTPVAKITKSDVIRYIIEGYFKNQED